MSVTIFFLLVHILLCVRFHNNTNCPLFFIPCLSSSSHGGLDIYTVPLLSPLRSGYNPLGAGSSRRPPSGAMGIPPAGARAPYRAPTGEVPVPSAIILIYVPSILYTIIYYFMDSIWLTSYFGQEWQVLIYLV